MTSAMPFTEVESVVRDPVRFKYKLDIGEDAYQSLRLKKYLLDAVDAGNGAIVGFGAAKSSVVASTFFAPSGLLGAIGVTSAATPLGWAVAAGVVGAGLSLVIGKRLVRGSSDQVRAVPDCINTPMDLLAVGLFDLLGMLGVKLALVDGRFHEAERTRIQSYFVDEWGYDERFVEIGLNEIETAADDHTIRQVAEQLANLKKENPDCNYATMAKEILEFLKDLSQADGLVDEREELAIEKVQGIFDEVNRFKVGDVLSGTLGKVTGAVSDARKKTLDGLTHVVKAAKQKMPPGSKDGSDGTN
jgi:uncharacterized tellurite resistance protein B-like protein